MGGGLLQLVAYGAQDAYISGNPQITFWKGLYKRHTNFAMEPFRINFTGQPNWGTKQSAVLGRHADLLYSTYVEVVLPYYSTNPEIAALWNNAEGRLGYNLIRYAEIEIGGQLIDRLYGEWLYLWDRLTNDFASSFKAMQMVGGSNPTLPLGVNSIGPTVLANPAQCNAGNGKPALPNVFYIPLYFFFTKNPGAALPLIALQYHEVKINLLWNKPEFISGNVTNTPFSSPTSALDAADGYVLNMLPNPVQAAIYVDYIYLDVEERRRMAQQSHEYLIEQTQYNEDKGISSYNNRVDLTFNHPVKELVWVVQPTSYTNCSLATNFPGPNGNVALRPFTYNQQAIYEQWLQINGQDRLDRRYGDYFNKVQIYQHHTGSQADASAILAYATGQYDYFTGGENFFTNQSDIYVYSFALRPEEHQPSGTCNFSRIDTATIVMNFSGAVTVDEATDSTWDVRVYATNYNILRIMSGMAGLAYSN
jgi:hypothetical protein